MGGGGARVLPHSDKLFLRNLVLRVMSCVFVCVCDYLCVCLGFTRFFLAAHNLPPPPPLFFPNTLSFPQNTLPTPPHAALHTYHSSIAEIEREMGELAIKAREGRIAMEDMMGIVWNGNMVLQY